MLTILIIIINVLIGIIIYLWRFTKRMNENLKVNREEHVILSKNDKRIVKDLQVFYTKQLKISEQITVLIGIAKTILQADTLNKTAANKDKTKLEAEFIKLKNINSSLLGEIVKLKHDLEQKEKELEEKREE